MILGLDISTSITGLTVLDYSGKVVLNEYIDFRKCDGFFKKTELAKERLNCLAFNEKLKIEKIFIEQSLQSFRPGASSANTLLTLAKFNGIISWLVYDLFGIQPEYIGATSARKKCGITVPKGQKTKQIVLKHMLDKEAWFVVDYTRHGNPRQHYYDMADSFIIAKAGLLSCQTKKK